MTTAEAPAREPETQPPDQPPGWRRLIMAAGRVLLFPTIATVIAFAIGALIVLATGNDPLPAFAALIDGGFGGVDAWGNTILTATPLIFTGLAVAVPFRAGLFNIGGEGQFYLGAVAAAGLGVALGWPGWLVVIAATVAAGLAGFLWGAIPGLLKLRGAHEVITTIMLNFVGINLTVWLLTGPLGGGGFIPGSAQIPPGNMIVPIGLGLGRAHYGFVLAVGAAAAAYVLLWRTARGFELRAVGLSPDAAAYAGMSVAANTVLALGIGALFAGLGGGIEVLGTYGRMSSPFVTGVGFAGIGVALLGRNHPAGVVLGALFFGGLQAGAQQMQFETEVPLDLAEILLAIVLLFVTATKLAELIAGRRARALVSGQRLETGLGRS